MLFTWKNAVKISVMFIMICLFSSFSFSQSHSLEVSDSEQIVRFIDIDILIPSEVEDNKYYVDLELLEGHLSDLSLMNGQNEVVMNNSLAFAPSNALYELDLTEFEKGDYTLRVRSYSEEINQDISVR